MKRVIMGLLWIILVANYCLSQVSFEISLDTEEDCVLENAAKDEYGNIVMIGNIGSFIEQNYDAFILKVSPDGSYITKCFDRKDTISYFTTIDCLNDGNYFITGSYSIDGNCSERDRLWVAIIDSELNIVIDKSYQIRENYIGFGAIACSLIDIEGNIVLTAAAFNEEPDEKTYFGDFAFYKFNEQGDTLLSKYYHYIWDELSWELRQMPGSDNMMLIERSTHYNNIRGFKIINSIFHKVLS